MDPRAPTVPTGHPKLKIPRPIEGATYIEQDLGRLIDWLVGGARLERRAEAALEPSLMSESEMAALMSDLEPVQIPEPIPGGDERTR